MKGHALDDGARTSKNVNTNSTVFAVGSITFDSGMRSPSQVIVYSI